MFLTRKILPLLHPQLYIFYWTGLKNELPSKYKKFYDFLIAPLAAESGLRFPNALRIVWGLELCYSTGGFVRTWLSTNAVVISWKKKKDCVILLERKNGSSAKRASDGKISTEKEAKKTSSGAFRERMDSQLKRSGQKLNS